MGAFIIYGGKTIYDLITNADDNPIFKEVGLRYSYSAKSSSEGEPNFYSQANLVGLKFAIGIKKPGMNLGVAAEGGYIGLSYEGLNLSDVVDYNGGYLVVGPLIRFGQNEPYSFTMEFLNGTSTHPSIGWISKSRMILQQRISTTGFLFGIHLGAVFYDLSLKDGLGQKDGGSNRDLSLIYGVESSWEF